MANKCSLEPQKVNEDVWYYEYPTNIELRVHRAGVLTVVLIPRRKLEASLKRMNASRRKRK